ncbi:MAG: manganese efflux pump MntP family protein [Bacteroidales bacterium]
MPFVEILLIAAGLSMDAFAVSVGAAASNRAMAPRATFRLSFHFGLFQCLMPIAGWLLGSEVAGFVSAVAGWIAWLLLTLVGGHMVYAGLAGQHEQVYRVDPSKGMALVALSVATSLDALAIGFSLAILHVRIWYPAVVIGIVTGTVSLVGVRLGARLGKGIGRPMEIAGGVLLVAIGLRILFGAR